MIMAKDSHGNYVEIEDIKQQDSFKGISPIEFKGSGENLENYRIYGNTMNGESIGDRTDNIIRDYIVIQTQAQYANVLFIDAELIPNTTYSFICLLNDSELRLYVNENLFNTVSYVKNGNVLKVIVKTLPELSDSQKINGKWIILKNSVTEPVIPQLSNIMMIKGSEMPEIYEPYGYRVPVKVEGKNLFNNIWEQGNIRADNGQKEASNIMICSDYFPVEYDKTYSISRTISEGYNNIRGYDASKNYIGGGTTVCSEKNPIVKANTKKLIFKITNSLVAFVRFNHYSNNLNMKYMIVEGDYTNTPMPPYEPYREPVITNLYLPEQIKMIGDEAEYIDFGEQKQHRVRKNLLQNTAKSQTINGVTFTVNSDGSVTCNGTATKITSIILSNNLNIDESTILSGCPINGSVDSYLLRFISLSPTIINEDVGSGTIINNFRIGNIEIRIASGYACDNLTFYPMIRKADILDDIYEPYITDTDIDVTLPAISTLSGTNALSVNTNIKPSKVWGGLNDPRDILYVKDKLGNILFSKYYEIEDETPLTYKAKKAGTLKDYRIYGNTVEGESVGDRTGNLFDKSSTTVCNAYFNESNTWIASYDSRSVVIPVSGGTQYTLSAPEALTVFRICEATQEPYIDGTYYRIVRASSAIDRYTFTTRSDTKYIIFQGSRTSFDTWFNGLMLNLGSTALPYEPYGYRMPVTIEGKNLLKNTATSQTINGVTFTVNSDGSVTCNTDENGATNNTFFSIPISLFANTLYKLSGCPSNGSNNSYRVDIRMTDTVIRDKNGTYVVDQGRGITFLLLNDIAFANVKIRIASGYVCDNLTFYPMIRKADITDDTYEPYHAPVTTPIYLPEQIRKVGDEAEYIDYGEQKQHRVRKNLLQTVAKSQTINGVTFTANEDKSVTCNGTATAATLFRLIELPELNDAEEYILSGCPANGSSTKYELQYSNNIDKAYRDFGNGININKFDYSTYNRSAAQIRIVSGYTCDNLTFYPMIRKASVTDDTYEPYIQDTELDVTLPILPTLSGTNTLSVGTEVQPSDIYLKGKIEKKPKIYYYSQDGQTLLYTESVLKGGNGTYSTTPTKPSTAQYTYTFVGWAA